MRRSVLFVFLLVLGMFSLTSCLKEDIAISKLDDLNDSKVMMGGLTGVIATREAKSRFPNAQFLEYPSPPDVLTALLAKKITAVAMDRPILEYILLEHDDLMIMPQDLAVGHISVGISFKRSDLIKPVNKFIKQYRRDGTYEDMYRRWVHDKTTTMPIIPEPKDPDGKVVIGVDSDNVPMSFIKDGQLVGFDIEFAKRLALFLNKKVVFKIMLYEALPTALVSGKIDLAIAQMDVMPERKSNIAFSDEYIDSPVAVMIRKSDYNGQEIASLKDLSGKKVGCITGSIYEDLIKKYVDNPKISSFSQVNQQIIAVVEGKLDAFVIDEPQALYLLAVRDDLKMLSEKMPTGTYAMAFKKDGTKLEKAFSAEIKKMREDGTLKKLQEKWFGGNEEEQKMPSVNSGGKKFLFGTFAEAAPFAFVRDGKIVGYEAEIAVLIANKLGYSIKFMPMDFVALIPALKAGRVDMIGGEIFVTEERKQSVRFSEPIYDANVVAVVKNETMTDAAGDMGFIQSCRTFVKEFIDGFDKTFVKEDRWKLVLKGLLVTVVITVFAVILGTILAFPVCMFSSSKHKILRFLAKEYISIVQGTPILVILMILYYVIFAKVEIEAVIVAIIAFAIDFAAYTGVMLRSGIDGIPKGQKEAALALGFTGFSAFMNFILPQAVRSILPVYRGEIISTLKATSIVGYIAIMDLTKMSDIIRSRTYDAFFPLISTAIIYFLAAKLLTMFLIFIEGKTNPEYRRNKMVKAGAK